MFGKIKRESDDDDDTIPLQIQCAAIDSEKNKIPLCRYTLTSVACGGQTKGIGHYVAYGRKNPLNSDDEAQWYYMNDDAPLELQTKKYPFSENPLRPRMAVYSRIKSVDKNVQ